MRLTCPNCDAQYEVPDEVIPDDGRDVQCSNCGDTWFQAKNESIEPEPAQTPTQPEDEPDIPDPLASEAASAAEYDQEPAQEPMPSVQQQEITPAASEILREEAERETQMRAAESLEPLESQPDLGLDNMPGDDSANRAREARDRMARMRGEDPKKPEEAANPGSRRGLLPDIEDINSTLRSSDDNAGNRALGPVHEKEPQIKRSGFARGFSLIMVLAVALGLIYAKASSIGQAIPQVQPVLSSYVGIIDQARVWVDARLGEYVDKE
jgi:predicted Zn finger-like uncharacterized protein